MQVSQTKAVLAIPLPGTSAAIQQRAMVTSSVDIANTYSAMQASYINRVTFASEAATYTRQSLLALLEASGKDHIYAKDQCKEDRVLLSRRDVLKGAVAAANTGQLRVLDRVLSGFRDEPTEAAKPWVYWYFMDGLLSLDEM